MVIVPQNHRADCHPPLQNIIGCMTGLIYVSKMILITFMLDMLECFACEKCKLFLNEFVHND